jgi:signal transduction histidine kinase
MRSLGAVMERHREEIMNRWAAQAKDAASARGLSGPELRNLMPSYLSALGGGERSTEQLRKHLESHLSSRIRQGFDLSEIVEEFNLLDVCMAALWTSLPPGDRPSDEDRQLVSASVRRTVVLVTQLFQEYMQLDEQREKRYMRLLQTVADEALHAPEAPMPTRLKELLELILEAMDALSAALVLYEPKTERLLLAASAGVANEEVQHYTSSIGLSALAAKADPARKPTSDAEVEVTLLTVSDALRQHGIRSLQGIRLPPHYRLFGVLYVGLQDERVLTARELRRLEALGDRLTLHLDNAKLYTDLREQVAELGLERDLRERFVSILAHDLRGPLSAAKMSSQVLLRRPERLDERQALAVRIERSLERMDRMIRDLLDVSRVRAGQRLPLRLDHCDLGAVAQGVVEELSATHGNRFDLVREQVVRGTWSQEELHRALWNLGMNAVRYGAPDRPIAIRVEQTPRGARVSVHNFGNPIPPEKRAGLFDLYSRLKEGAGTGWGLGLALVRACAEAHGGQVAIAESSEEAGTTFTIDLPTDSRPFQQTEVVTANGPVGAIPDRGTWGPNVVAGVGTNPA